jgi:hypothetical protein
MCETRSASSARPCCFRNRGPLTARLAQNRIQVNKIKALV